MAVVTEQTITEEESITNLSDEEKHDAAISMAEAALRKKRWTEKFRNKELHNVLGALGLLHPKGADANGSE